MTEVEKRELYRALVAMCQAHGFTSDHTYDLLHQAVESIRPDGDDEDDEKGDE